VHKVQLGQEEGPFPVLKKEEEENVCKWPAYQHLRLELVALFIP